MIPAVHLVIAEIGGWWLRCHIQLILTRGSEGMGATTATAKTTVKGEGQGEEEGG